MILHAARNSRGRRPERIYESPILRQPTLLPSLLPIISPTPSDFPSISLVRNTRARARARVCTCVRIARNTGGNLKSEPRLPRSGQTPIKPIQSIKFTSAPRSANILKSIEHAIFAKNFARILYLNTYEFLLKESLFFLLFQFRFIRTD